MDIKPIRTKTDYRAALKEIETLMSARAGTPEGERLNLLAALVESYEKKHFRTPEGLPLRPAGTLPVEMYSDKRISE